MSDVKTTRERGMGTLVTITPRSGVVKTTEQRGKMLVIITALVKDYRILECVGEFATKGGNTGN